MADRLASPDDNASYSLSDAAAVACHAAVPIAPPKKAKREEVLAVAVLAAASSEDTRWLMVKRPSTGLLAGQWEFPSVCVWNSADENKKNGKGSDSKEVSKKKTAPPKKKAGKDSSAAAAVPLIKAGIRSAALDVFLGELVESSSSGTSGPSRKVILSSLSAEKRNRVKDNDPTEHVFSHVRHTMYIEYGELIYKDQKQSNSAKGGNYRWTSKHKREVGWLSEGDMADVGITSGVRKALAVARRLGK